MFANAKQVANVKVATCGFTCLRCMLYIRWIRDIGMKKSKNMIGKYQRTLRIGKYVFFVIESGLLFVAAHIQTSTLLATDKNRTLKEITFTLLKCICQVIHSDNNNGEIMLRRD